MTASVSLRLPRDGDCVLFSPDAAVDEYLLLEVTEEQLAAITQRQAPHGFELRGPADSEAVLVSEHATYGVRLVETSNTALLLDAGDGQEGQWRPTHSAQQTVRGQVSRHYELSEVRRPPVCHLRSLLLQSGLYGGLLSADYDASSAGADSLYSFEQLRRLVQASDEQLRVQLHSIAAYEVDGCYRLLDDEYGQSLLHDVVNAVIETRQRADRVDKAAVVATIGHLHPPTMTEQCLHTLAAYSPSHSGQQHIALCPERLSRHLAHSIFNSAPPASHYQPADQLVQRITAAMPAPLACQPAYLLSIAVSLPAVPPAPPTYRYLAAHSLPLDVQSRLGAMFAVKDKWSSEEMAAWMADIASVAAADGRGNKADSALLKTCRLVTEKDANGSKVYYVSNAHK